MEGVACSGSRAYLLSNCYLMNRLSDEVVWFLGYYKIPNLLPVPAVDSRGQLWAWDYRYKTGRKEYTESGPKHQLVRNPLYFTGVSKARLLRVPVCESNLIMSSLPLLVHSQLCQSHLAWRRWQNESCWWTKLVWVQRKIKQLKCFSLLLFFYSLSVLSLFPVKWVLRPELCECVVIGLSATPCPTDSRATSHPSLKYFGDSLASKICAKVSSPELHQNEVWDGLQSKQPPYM